VVIPGIVVSAGKTNVKATIILVKCSNCGHEKKINLPPGFNGVGVPRSCDNSRNPGPDKQQCKLDTYRTVSEKCRYVDQQVLKLQEMPENIPTGDMPRTFLLYTARYLTDKVNPGSRIKVVGVFSVFSRGGGPQGSNQQVRSSIRQAYVRVLGLQSDVYGQGSHSGFALPTISHTDEEKILTMAKDKDIFNKVSKSIAPSIFGHPDIKRAIACLLFGGSPKKLADGMKLRGDINVLLLGDPSTAKSQFLKFVERAAPISVYTSGKGSSAAGLTASVIKDGQSGEFQLEGGAMVLADGGVVCIDEFDKMRAQDRVAIHEAMEQQTISIAKAGITTQLNSRTSVLAAANPLSGRYDDLKHAAEQIDFQSAILSRFDCIFIVKDIRDDANDKRIASHILDLHTHQNLGQQVEGEIPLDDLKKYITYAKTRVRPRLSEEAAHQLQDLYVSDRQASKDQRLNAKNTGIPITVRQLEAIIRLSEAIAKIHLAGTVEIQHVQEAHRLFRVSTLNAAKSGVGTASEAPAELQNIMRKVEEAIKRRVAIATKISYQRLQAEMLQRFDNVKAIEYVRFFNIFRHSSEWSRGMSSPTTSKGRFWSANAD